MCNKEKIEEIYEDWSNIMEWIRKNPEKFMASKEKQKAFIGIAYYNNLHCFKGLGNLIKEFNHLITLSEEERILIYKKQFDRTEEGGFLQPHKIYNPIVGINCWLNKIGVIMLIIMNYLIYLTPTFQIM